MFHGACQSGVKKEKIARQWQGSVYILHVDFCSVAYAGLNVERPGIIHEYSRICVCMVRTKKSAIRMTDPKILRREARKNMRNLA